MFVQHAVHHLVIVKFIGNIAHDLFDHILQGDQARGSTELVHHNGHVDALVPELLQEIIDLLGLGNVKGFAQQLIPIEIG
ncbi:MAG: Uncharacterised protein [Flavobacteriia bacterium]|nr:MAG: Uncharacterised protein [Flavobacteriia bacterium]